MAAAKNYQESASSDNYSDSDYEPPNQISKIPPLEASDGGFKRKRSPKSESRNAQLARQNRLRNKMYVASLENDVLRERSRNIRANSMIKKLETMLKKKEQEVKYLKGIIANSGDIMKLLRNIHDNTGLEVGMSMNNSMISHDDNLNFEEDLSSFLPKLDMELPLNFLEDETPDKVEKPLSEHNYTLASDSDHSDFGVCLHVSNHKVALEFCSSCNDSANQLWSKK